MFCYAKKNGIIFKSTIFVVMTNLTSSQKKNEFDFAFAIL